MKTAGLLLTFAAITAYGLAELLHALEEIPRD